MDFIMLDVKLVKELVDDLCYELDRPHFKYSYSSYSNIKSVKDWLVDINENWAESITASDVLRPIYETLKSVIEQQESKVDRDYSQEYKKSIYFKLLDGTLTPSVIKYPDGKISLEDYELLGALVKYNDMNDILKLACSRSYVEGILNKYRPLTKEDEEAVFGNTYFLTSSPL